MGTTLDPSTGGWEVEKQFGWCQAASHFPIQKPFLPLSFPFPLRTNYVYAFFFGSAVDQNPEPHVFWASGLLLSPITGTVTTFLNYFVI